MNDDNIAITVREGERERKMVYGYVMYSVCTLQSNVSFATAQWVNVFVRARPDNICQGTDGSTISFIFG